MQTRGIAVHHAVHREVAVAALALLDGPVALSLANIGSLFDFLLFLLFALRLTELSNF